MSTYFVPIFKQMSKAIKTDTVQCLDRNINSEKCHSKQEVFLFLK